MPSAAGQDSTDSESNVTGTDSVLDTKPSGQPFYRPPDFSRQLAIIFRQVISGVYCALSPLIILTAGLGLLGQAVWWRVLSLIFWRSIDPVAANDGWDQWIYPMPKITFSRVLGNVSGSDSLVHSSYGYYLGPWAALAKASGWEFGFQLLGAVGSLVIWAIVATLICRLLGLRMTVGSGRWKQAWQFTRASILDSLGSIAIPLMAALVLAMPLMVCGWLLIFDWSSPIGAVLTLVCGLTVFPMAVVLVGLLLCWPLMFPAIAVEGRDCFESISRGYAYVLQRPFHYLGLFLVISVAGSVLTWLLTLMGTTAMEGLHWGLAWGANLMSPDRLQEVLHPVVNEQEGTSAVVTQFTSPVLQFWAGGIGWLVRSASIAVFWGLATAVYLLMRNYLDQTPLDSIYVPGQENKLAELEKVSS